MNRKLKVTLIISSLIVLAVAILIAVGLYGMAIEDRYGDNQDIFYSCTEGDIVVNHETKEIGEIKKTWTRFYVVNNFDTIDTYSWWNDKKIEVYKFTDSESVDKNFDYSDLNRMIEEGRLELKKNLR